jgi:hypothetical protein
MAANGITARSSTNGQAVINGIYIPRLKQWNIAQSSSESAWGDSDSVGFTNRKKARRDCTGSLTGVQQNGTGIGNDIMAIVVNSQPVNPQDLAGRIVSIQLWETGVASDNWWFPSALIQNFNITYDMDTKEVVEWTIDFGADGVFYRPYETATGRPTNTYKTVTV